MSSVVLRAFLPLLLVGSVLFATSAPAPTIHSASPSQLNSELPFALTLTGTGFSAASKVVFDDKTAVTITSQTATKITVDGTTQSAPGTKIHVTVSNPSPGAAVSNIVTITVDAPVTITVSPKAKTMRGLTSTKFVATVANSINKNVNWTVSADSGFSGSAGIIEADGTYFAPAVIPPSVTITAQSVADSSKSDTAQITLQNPTPEVVSATTPIQAGANASLIINGRGFAPGAQVLVGNMPLNVQWVNSSTLIASGPIQAPTGGVAAVIVQNPNPGAATSNAVAISVLNNVSALSYAAASRFLQHATWGPTPASVAHLQAIGISAWLDEQFAEPISTYSLPVDTTSGLSTLQEQFFSNAMGGADQLRQRVAFTLGQIAVVSGEKLPEYYEMMPYQQMLLNDAFGTYYTFFKDVTLSPVMGNYLDMVNNNVPSGTVSADENYARESMQLLSIGLAQLNANGTPTTTPPTATYSEDDVRALARVLTGWTYPACYAASKWTNPACFQSPMVAVESHHDNSAKLFLGVNIQTGWAEGDLDLALQTIENYTPAQSASPNIAPFVSLRLIQHLVTSNPTPDYVGRVANVFTQSGGDLKQTVAAILTDSEANDENSGLAAGQGHLTEPVLYAVSLLRALNATTTSAPLAGSTSDMGQNLFYSPSVFNYYSPFYQIPGTALVAPEFQILSQSTSFYRANFAYRAAYNQLSNQITVDLSNFAQLASDTHKATETASLTIMLNAVSQTLLGGPMTTAMLNAIMPAMLATTDAMTRARTAVYLVAASSAYQVQNISTQSQVSVVTPQTQVDTSGDTYGAAKAFHHTLTTGR